MPSTTESPAKVDVEVTVNGKEEYLQVEPRMLLVEMLREELGLTGAHVGCESSYCGACTVLLDGEPVKTCTVFAVQAHESEITTVEGLSEEGELHELQESFSENHALQCGYCTPGLLMSGKALLDRNPDATKKEIKKAISGNVCRCTGYQNIVKAIDQVTEGSSNDES
jgi:carbon-monoxide dehydrogenase small subunit